MYNRTFCTFAAPLKWYTFQLFWWYTFRLLFTSLRSVKKSCCRIWDTLKMISELRSAFSYILYTLERWQCSFRASQETFLPCSSITALIIFPTCTFCIKNRELLFEVRGSGLPITAKQESSRFFASISAFFLQ